MVTSTPSSSKPSFLSLPPELIHKILLHLLHLLPSSPVKFATTLTSRNEETFTDLYELPSLRPFLQEAVEGIEIDWTSTIPSATLSKLSNIKSLSISQHRLASSYLTVFHDAPLNALRLVGVTVPPFLRMLSNTANLKELSLSFITTTVEKVDGLALEKLELTGISNLKHEPLTSLLSTELKSLHLSYLRHSSINNNTINAIASCKNLKQLTLSHLQHCTPDSISVLLTHLHGLQALTLASTQLSSHALCNFLKSAKELTHLSFEEPAWTASQTGFFLRNLSNPLRSFELRDVPGVTDYDVSRVINSMQNLESLSLRRHPNLTVLSSISISTLRIRKLNLRGVFLSDQALTFLSRLSLHDISLGGDDQLGSTSLTDCIGHVSNAGMEKLLKRSPELKKFFWESPRSSQVLLPLTTDQLDARRLAEMLRRYCVRLERVEVNWLRPRSVNMVARAEAARCDLAFLELEEATGAVVLVDERPLY